ncbi:MAG: hypothetical protein L3K14_00915 [Thermoplasmata archaeon]|nr:hypothetical protein [Thermoplasmata archaeon]
MAPERRQIDDLIMLGRAAPDTLKDGRTTICAAGYSPTHGFIRVYPTRLSSPLKQWSCVSVPLERNPQDTRDESWKIEGSKGEWATLDSKIEVRGLLSRPERIRLIPQLASPCVSTLNESHVSLGIVRPAALKGYLSDRSDVDSTIQLTLFGGPTLKTKADYRMQPRLEYRCDRCVSVGPHDQQVLEIGCYEWFRKHPGQEAKVFENLHLDDPAYEKFLLVGNQAFHRASYLVIGIIRWKRAAS